MHKTKITEEKARVYQHKKNDKNKHMENNKNKPNTKGGEIETGKLKIIYLNIRSIKNKMQELQLTLKAMKEKPHIIIVGETWLKTEDEIFYQIDEYEAIFNSRKENKGGGIAMYINKNIKFENILNTELMKSHIMVVKLIDLNIKICGYYRSPATKTEFFLEYLEKQLEKNNNLICLGDTNIDLIKCDNNDTKKFLQILGSNNFTMERMIIRMA